MLPIKANANSPNSLQAWLLKSICKAHCNSYSSQTSNNKQPATKEEDLGNGLVKYFWSSTKVQLGKCAERSLVCIPASVRLHSSNFELLAMEAFILAAALHIYGDGTNPVVSLKTEWGASNFVCLSAQPGHGLGGMRGYKQSYLLIFFVLICARQVRSLWGILCTNCTKQKCKHDWACFAPIGRFFLTF